jgi:hypothetical protein
MSDKWRFPSKPIFYAKSVPKSSCRQVFYHSRQDAADIFDLCRGIIGLYIILDKRSWFNGISWTYQKCPT